MLNNIKLQKVNEIPAGAKTVDGIGIFIIPNPAYEVTAFKRNSYMWETVNAIIGKTKEEKMIEYMKEDLKMSYDNNTLYSESTFVRKAIESFGSCKPKDTFVEIWAHLKSDKESNFSAHGLDDEVLETLGYVKEKYKDKYDVIPSFPNCMPKHWFDGLKEGDRIFLKSTNSSNEDVYFIITLQQQGYRYARFGNFEEVVEKVTSRYSHSFDYDEDEIEGDEEELLRAIS